MSISIIIPCFNCSDFIEKSILNALKFADKVKGEVIAINDGSTDSTLKVIKRIKSDRLVIIDKKNEGVSVARNDGIERSKFDYLFFIDSDDYINYDILFNKFDFIKQYDFSYWDAVKIWANGKELPYPVTESKSNVELIRCLCHRNFQIFIGGFIVNKVKLSGIYFDNNFSYGEDIKFIIECLNASDKVYKVKELNLYYYQHQSSAMNKFNSSRFDSLKAIKSLKARNIDTSLINCLLSIDAKVIAKSYIRSNPHSSFIDIKNLYKAIKVELNDSREGVLSNLLVFHLYLVVYKFYLWTKF